MFNRLYQYILYRQLDQVTEHYPDSVVAYARDSTEFILICSAVFGEPLIQTALWSEQIEYDEDNVELLFNTYDEIWRLVSICSYGYRPNRSAQQAVKRVQQYAEEGYTYAVSLDLSKYFDTMNQHMLLNMVRVHVKDKRESSETSARI